MSEQSTKVRERPILFTDAMVRAILDGRKTQTRRPVKPRAQVCAECLTRSTPHNEGDGGMGVFGTGAYLRVPACDHNDRSGERTTCPYGAPGDRLWVREAWCLEIDNNTARPTGLTLYRADGESVVLADGDGFTVHTKSGYEASPWKPSIHMKRVHARLLLEVTAVRVERVQAITEEDARAEGFAPGVGFVRDESGEFANDARSRFMLAWERMYSPERDWKRNPWVWVVSFRRVEASK